MYESPLLKLAVSIAVLLVGLGCAWFYLREARPRADHAGPLAGHRPWRKLGAAICLLVSVMFVLGVYLVDIPDHPRAYALFWTIILVLMLWLCALAFKDVKYTLRLLRAHRHAASDRATDRAPAPTPRGKGPSA